MNSHQCIAVLNATAVLLALVGCSSPHRSTQNGAPAPPPGQPAEQPQRREAPRLYPAFIMAKNQKRWGYIGRTGKFVIEPQYEDAGTFDWDGLAVVRQSGKEGLIDADGNVVLSPVYDSYSLWLSGERRGASNGSTQKVFVDGAMRFELAGSISGSGWPAPFGRTVQDSYRYGYVGWDGTVLIEPQYLDAGEFHDGLALVQTTDHQYFLIDQTGKQIRALNFDSPGHLSEGLMIFLDKATGRHGYISVTGEIVIAAQFADANPFSGGVAIVNTGKDYIDNKFGLINRQGEFLIPATYSSLKSIGDGLYAAGAESRPSIPDQFVRKAIVDQRGHRLTDFAYYEPSKMENGLISVTDESSTFYLDKTGAKVRNLPVLSGIGRLTMQGDLIQADIDGDLSYLTREGKPVWQSDRTVTLSGELRVVTRKYRPNRYVRIEYPELSGFADAKVQTAINDQLRKHFGITGEPTSPQAAPSKIHDDFNEFFTADQIGNLLIIDKWGSDYPIGAVHGMPLRDYYHFDLASGTQYGLADLFKKESRYTERLQTLVAKQIAQREDARGYKARPEVRPDHNFTVTSDGLAIYYYPYEIAPYSAGFPTFDIPWRDISDLIDTNGAFWKSLTVPVRASDR